MIHGALNLPVKILINAAEKHIPVVVVGVEIGFQDADGVFVGVVGLPGQLLHPVGLPHVAQVPQHIAVAELSEEPGHGVPPGGGKGLHQLLKVVQVRIEVVVVVVGILLLQSLIALPGAGIVLYQGVGGLLHQGIHLGKYIASHPVVQLAA